MPIQTENWDTPAAPAFPPAGWSANANLGTLVPGDALGTISSPNVVHPLTASGVVFYTTWQTLDGNNGDVSALANFGYAGIQSATLNFVVFARGSSTTCGTGTTQYEATWNVAQSTGAGTIKLFSRVSGTATQIGTVSFTASPSVWFQINLTCSGSVISVTVQRMSDSFWLTSGGTYQSGAATAISVSSATITGQGYAGIALSSTHLLLPHADDWTLSASTAANIILTPYPKLIRRRLTVPEWADIYG